MRSKSIVFTGYYGFSNFGDDLFPMACTNGASLLTRPTEALILAPPINGVSANFLVPQVLASAYRRQSRTGKAIRLFFLLYAAIKYRSLVLAGGSTIASGTSHRMRTIQYYLARLGLCNISAVGVSLGPFESESDRQFAIRFLNTLKFIVVRDNASHEESKKLTTAKPVQIGYDLAALLPKQLLSRTAPPRKDFTRDYTLGVSICNYESLTGGDHEHEINRNRAIFSAICRFATENNIRVNIIELNSDKDLGDTEISKNLNRFLEQESIPSKITPYVDPISTLNALQEVDFLLSVRLHGAVVAYLQGTPFVLLEYHRKCSDFLDTIQFDCSGRIKNNLDAQEIYRALTNAATSSQKPRLSREDYISHALECFTSQTW